MGSLRGVGYFFSILIFLFGMAAINNGEAESKSFFQCYTSFSSMFSMFNQFTPATVDFTDPQFKEYISNFCNFYHEKTGKWFEALNDKPDAKLGEEFNQKYGSTMPDSMKEFANMSVLD